MSPFGTSVDGSWVSSAASGTPSMARKNQIANGKAAQMPTTPKGKNELAPAAFVGSMVNRFDTSNCGIMPIMNAASAMTATTVMPNVTLSASPTP